MTGCPVAVDVEWCVGAIDRNIFGGFVRRQLMEGASLTGTGVQ